MSPDLKTQQRGDIQDRQTSGTERAHSTFYKGTKAIQWRKTHDVGIDSPRQEKKKRRTLIHISHS